MKEKKTVIIEQIKMFTHAWNDCSFGVIALCAVYIIQRNLYLSINIYKKKNCQST